MLATTPDLRRPERAGPAYVLDRAWRCGGSQVRMTAIRPMPGGLLSPDLCTRDLFAGLGERVATHAGGRLGAARARRAWQSRHCAATLGVWVPRHPSRRGTLPRYSRNAARPTPGRTARRGRLGARRQTPVRPGPPSPSIRAHSSTRCNSTTHPSRAAPLSQGPARKLRCDPMGRRELAIEAGLVVRRHNARTGDWCSRPSWSRSCATDDS